jgi:hypothetical protein
MSKTASPARATAAIAAATKDLPAGKSASSEVWLKKIRLGIPAMTKKYSLGTVSQLAGVDYPSAAERSALPDIDLEEPRDTAEISG